MVGIFLVGKVLHAFVLSAVEGRAGTDWSTDEGSKTDERLGIEYSIDCLKDGIPRELKTSRSLFLPKKIDDLWTYAKQTLVYMVAENSLVGEIWVLYLNCKIDGQTFPQFKAYRLTVAQEDLDALRVRMREIRDTLQTCLDNSDPSPLPLCEKYKCGEGNCGHWDVCRPEGRYKPADPELMDIKPSKKYLGAPVETVTMTVTMDKAAEPNEAEVVKVCNTRSEVKKRKTSKRKKSA